jgi:epoxyqueuosine reductase QueG
MLNGKKGDKMDKEKLKGFAKEVKADLIGVASIDRFKGIGPQNHPESIFPEVKSVIVIGKRITRGALRGIEEGTQFSLYSIYGYHWLNNRILALTTFKICEFLEDNGYEAVPLPDIPCEVPPMGIPVKKGKPAPNVLIDIEDAAIRAGLGEIGYCGIFLTEEFGPRQRFQIILTDAEIEPDPIKKENVCDLCKDCLKICPIGAIGKKEKEIKICGKKMIVAEIDYEKCKKCKNGVVPNMYYENGKPDRIAALCSRTCLSHLEEKRKIKNTFNEKFRKRPVWKIDKSGEIIEE